MESTYDADALIREWFWSSSDRAQRALDALVEAIVQAPAVPAHEIDRWIESYRSLPRTGRDDRSTRVRIAGLTHRQLRALELSAAGLPRKAIALAMGIQDETVKNHLSRARYRLGATNTSHAVAIAMRRGLIS